MKHTSLRTYVRKAGLLLATTSLQILLLPGAVTAQGASSEGEKMMQEMMQRMAEVTALGEHHEALAQFLGDWDLEIKLTIPGAPNQSWAAKAHYEWLIDGRWLGQRIVGTFMDQPFESFSINGYDTYAKNHVAISVSSHDNAIYSSRGLATDPTGKITTLFGTINEYMTGELNKPVKVVIRVENENRHVLEIWDMAIGETGASVLEYVYTRAKS